MAATKTKYTKAQAEAFYETMCTIRKFEETVKDDFLAGESPDFVHLYIGEEAIATGVCAALRPTDLIESTHHKHVNMGLAVAKGDGLIVPNVSVEEWKTFHDWAKENESKCSEEFNDSLLDHFYMDNEDDVAEWLNSRDSIPCTSMSEACDYFLIKHCPIEHVQDRLQCQYGDDYDNIKQGIHKSLTIEYPSLRKFKILDKTSNKIGRASCRERV